MEENFVKYGMVPEDDTFKNLHDTIIHNLENFMNSNNSK